MLILGLRPANERRRYKVTPSPIGWAQTYECNICLQITVWLPLPSLIFGMTGTVAGFLSALLPETLGKELPDTIEEVEKRPGWGHVKCKLAISANLNADDIEWTVYAFMRLLFQHIEVETKWPPFPRRHFRMHFLEWNIWISISSCQDAFLECICIQCGTVITRSIFSQIFTKDTP